MRITERQVDISVPYVRAVADPTYLKNTTEAFAHSFCHVGCELAHKAMHRALLLRVARAFDLNSLVLDVEGIARRHTRLQFAHRPFNCQNSVLQACFDTLVENY